MEMAAGAQPGRAELVAAVVLCLAALALVSGRSGRRRTRRRLVAVLAPARPRSDRVAAGLGTPGLTTLVAGLAGVAVAVIVGGLAGALVGVLVAVALDRGLRRLEPRAVRQRRVAVAEALPFAADLLAAVLRSGAPTARAVGQVAEAVGGPLGEHLDTVARGLRLGAPADEAWQALAGVPAAAPLVRAAVRASESGAALAGACGRLATEQRAAHESAADVAARRAGVLVVLPLGCCFLPAFVLLGVVPIVLGVLDDLRF